MNIIAVIFLLLSVWSVEERTGHDYHPILPFLEAPLNDSALAYDVLNYRLVLDVDIPAETLSAEAEITLSTLVETDSIRLHFAGLEIAGVEENSQSRSFLRQDSFLVVSLDRTVPAHTGLILKVYYHGEPTNPSSVFGKGLEIAGSGDDDAVTYACNAPWGAKYWFPCQDNPADKATMEMIVTVPEGNEVISNGILESADRTGPEWTYTWTETHPIATYLLVFAASENYALTEDTGSADGTPVPIFHWVLAPDSAQVTPKLMVVSDIMSYFSELFYPYPFADEKYAHVYAPIGGAMENQTCTHINTTYNWDWDVIVAHEFSHSWWGNSTTCRKLKHMWLNEGFATYCEALWIEHRDGPQAYQEYYHDAIADVYLGHGISHNDPVLDPPWSRIYSPLTYEKPASVLHMLRRLTGDVNFFAILRTYGLRFQDSTALSEDFEAVVTEITGDDYSWFFDQWLREPGHPQYLVTWETEPVGDSFDIIIRLRQTQNWPPEVPVFRMPVELGLVAGDDTSYVSFTDSLADQLFEVKTAQEPSEVVFDPHGDLLCEITYSGIAEGEDDADDAPFFTIPSLTGGRLKYTARCEENISITMFDVSGRKVESWYDVKPEGYLDLGNLSSGVYFVKVWGKTTQTRRVVIVE